MDEQMQGLNDVIMGSSSSNPNLQGFPFPNHQSPMLELDYNYLDNFFSNNGECNLGDNYMNTNTSTTTNNNNNICINNNNMGKQSEFQNPAQNNDVYVDMPSDFSSYLERLFADVDSIPQSLLNQESTVPVNNNNNSKNYVGENATEKPMNDDYSLNYVVSRGMQQDFTGSKNCDVVGGVITSCNNMPGDNNNSSNFNTNNYNYSYPSSNVNMAREIPPVPVFKVPEPPVLPVNDNNDDDNSDRRKKKKAKKGSVARKTNPICPTAPYAPRADTGWPTRNDQPPLLPSPTPSSPPKTTTAASSSLLASNQCFSGGLIGHYQALSTRALMRSPYFPSSRERDKFLGGDTTPIDDALLKKKWRYPSLGGSNRSITAAKTSITAATTASSSRFTASGSLPNASSWSRMDGSAGPSRTNVTQYGSTMFGGTKNGRPLFGDNNHVSSSLSSPPSWQDLLRPTSSPLSSRHDYMPWLTYELLNPPVDNSILFRITNEGDPSKGDNANWKITPYLNPNPNNSKNTNSDLQRNNISIGAKNTPHDVTTLPLTAPNPNTYIPPGMGVAMQQGQDKVVSTNFNNQTGGGLPVTSYTAASSDQITTTTTSSWDDILAAATATLTSSAPTPQVGPGQQFQAPPGNIAATMGQNNRESWQPQVQTENYRPGPQQFQASPGNVVATIGQDNRESWQPQVQTENYASGPQQFQAPTRNVAATIGQDNRESWQLQVQKNYGPRPQQFQAPPGNIVASIGQDREYWQPQNQTENYRPGPQQFQAPPGNVAATIGQERESWQPHVQTENYGPGPQQFKAPPGNVAATIGRDKETWQPQVQSEDNGPGPVDPMGNTDIDDFINFDAMMNYWPECDLVQYEKFGFDM